MSLIHKIGLTLIKTVGHVTAKSLFAHFGCAEDVFNAGIKELMQVPGVGEITAVNIRDTDALQNAEQQLKFLEKHDIQVLFFTDDNYPYRLRQCIDAPILLYYRGTADLNHSRIISVVGTRRATDYGKRICRQLAETLQPYNVLVVSGLAYGIDVAAHKESLAHQIPTVGVLGHGLDRIYPHLHKDVAHRMTLNGGLLTEFPLHTSPDREHFPMRNRIIAGIADATVVVEATIKGGALITAEIANSYSRDVYAFPGRINDEYSEGCNFLVKTNRAALLNHPKDLLYYLGWDDVLPQQKSMQMQLPINLSKAEQKIADILKAGPTHLHDIIVRSELPQNKMAIHLLNLEMQGIVICLPGNLYKLN
jgi:DNA processing protein